MSRPVIVALIYIACLAVLGLPLLSGSPNDKKSWLLRGMGFLLMVVGFLYYAGFILPRPLLPSDVFLGYVAVLVGAGMFGWSCRPRTSSGKDRID